MSNFKTAMSMTLWPFFTGSFPYGACQITENTMLYVTSMPLHPMSHVTKLGSISHAEYK